MSDTMIPSVRLSREARCRACTLGKYPRRLTVESTKRCVRRPTLPVLFKTLDTVAVETPAAFATSRIVRPIFDYLAARRQTRFASRLPGAVSHRGSIDEKICLTTCNERCNSLATRLSALVVWGPDWYRVIHPFWR